ncbi:alanine racemase [Blastopirellula marina]|uniref:Alanine racemase n=1 Tax=Blastopirellula marina TaxID=124 RepID=A0A2S8GDB5_9BACT|nr:alanine racemase [Blastopirellula marina]PQO42300.1 alanine racemase [Blastopirellula marina]
MVVPFEKTRDSLVATPSLIVDLPTVERNLTRLHQYARQAGIQVRPHTKTHKSLHFAQRQIDHGSSGLTVAKVGEAEVMASVCDDILIAYPAIDPERRRRIAELARQCTVHVAIDSDYAVEMLGAAAAQAESTVGILIDINVGADRTGVADAVASLELAKMVAAHPSLRLDGIFFYPGQVWLPANEQGTPLQQIDATLSEAIDLWAKHDLPCPIVSGGSTPTAYQSHGIRSQTEIRPGTYLFNDMNTVRAGFCELEDCAAAIVCTVVSTAVPGKGVIDAGSKTLTSDRNVLHPDSGHGHVIEYPAAVIVRLSEEHGEIDFTACPSRPSLGERITIIPNHICPCVNLQNRMILQDADGKLTTTTVDARGLLS